MRMTPPGLNLDCPAASLGRTQRARRQQHGSRLCGSRKDNTSGADMHVDADRFPVQDDPGGRRRSGQKARLTINFTPAMWDHEKFFHEGFRDAIKAGK
jgi:hypothetical protein